MVKLDKYESAIFYIEMKFDEAMPIEEPALLNTSKKLEDVVLSRERHKHNMYEWQNKRIYFIYNKLKEKYPDEKYAEEFITSKENENWLKPLIQPTNESKACDYLFDGIHCKMQRTNTTCYTCCFYCKLNESCKNTCVYKLT